MPVWAQSITIPGDIDRGDNSGWTFHDLGASTHCLKEGSGNASVLYRDAPATSSAKDQLLIYLPGGGSCNSPASCLKDPPYNIEGYSVNMFKRDPKLDNYLYLRTKPPAKVNSDDPDDTLINPFLKPGSEMNLAMIPYCTGDAHSGQQVRKDTKKTPAEKYYYVGNINFDEAIKFLLTQRYPSGINTIWLMGTSAGANGAAFQYSRLRSKFVNGNRQIHLIEDSSKVVPNEVEDRNNIITWQSCLPGCGCPEPTALPAFAATSSASSSRSSKGTSKSRSALVASEATNNEPSPFGDPAPFPPEDSQSMVLTKRRPPSMNSLTEADAKLQPPAGSCMALQTTRLYNRGLDSTFRWSFIGFDWDQVLNTTADDITNLDNYYGAMIAKNAELEAGSNALTTKHLYINNRNVRIPDRVPPEDLCGRHVVTNFRPFVYDTTIPLQDDTIQQAHYKFIKGMILGSSAWATGEEVTISRCPTDLLLY